MVSNTQGSILSILYKLGWLVRKLSMDDTLSPSKKNWVVISFPFAFTQVRRHPFSTKNMVLEILPSCKRRVFAGTFRFVKRERKSSHLLVMVGVLNTSKIYKFFCGPDRFSFFY